jgi:hypothetical protein
MTARYLTNQLLYQREPVIWFDNRRNSTAEIVGTAFRDTLRKLGISPRTAPTGSAPLPGSCTALILDLLQRILQDDFSEYNAKPYQRETRNAILNLHSYAYDHEVRLAARMVLDYISAKLTVSSNDLRRLVPFRRRNEGAYVSRDPEGFMTCGILQWQDGADSIGQAFAILAGNTRVYETLPPMPNAAAKPWRINDDGLDAVLDVLSDYRLPWCIHDLFVNDAHRRFHQRMHRTARGDETGNRNCDNMEIYASSPSYLITAGGAPAGYAIDPYFLGVPRGPYEQQRGVAVTTSFMPTTYFVRAIKADDLIQFGAFSDTAGITANYGVAPDFACGHQLRLPRWVEGLKGTTRYVSDGDYTFVDPKPTLFRLVGRPGFYLSIFQQGGLALLEAWDTWLHPSLDFASFQARVKNLNPGLRLQNNVPFRYVTANGNKLDAVIGLAVSSEGVIFAVANVTHIDYSATEPHDSFGHAGDVTDRFLNGTVLNNTADGVIEITNHFVGSGTKITLDMSDALHPRRISENGSVEQAGFNHEVWLDCEWTGPTQGDVFRPFNTVSAATAAVAAGGVIKMIPGRTRERSTLGARKAMTLRAPIGGVVLGVS